MSFKVNHPDKNISLGIRFFYKTDEENGLLEDACKRRVTTSCEIGIYDNREFKEVLARGVAVKCPEDLLNKGFGRRTSLGRAVKNLMKVVQGDKEGLKKSIWEEYFRMHTSDKVGV